MAFDGGAGERMAAKMVCFDFYGDQIDIVTGDSTAHVVIRKVCDVLGLGFGSQLQRLKDDPAITVTMIVTVAEDGKYREVACLDVRQLPLWLAKIHASKVKESCRAKLVRYQREAGEVLADRFIGRRGAADIPEELREAAAVLPGLVQRVQELEATLASFPKMVSDHPILKTAAARLYILDPIKDIARMKALAIQKAGERVIRKLRFSTERALRAELGYTMAPAHSWANFPTSRLGEACCVLARMRAEAQCLLDAVHAAKQTNLSIVK